MKLYTLTRRQTLPITLTEAWNFFSKPDNLGEITPEQMVFRILSKTGGDNMYPGQIIRYRVKVFPLVTLNWVTEITHVSEPNYFVDEQRFGPYSFWHHQHHFKAVPNGVEMVDELTYGLPLGILGQLANILLVKRQLNTIFDYRYQILEERFPKNPKSL